MRHDIPAAYAVFRTAWSAVHFVLLAALFVLVLWWWFDDGQGDRFLSDWWQTSVSISTKVFYFLPFPWGVK